jgi:hypothetical protein
MDISAKLQYVPILQLMIFTLLEPDLVNQGAVHRSAILNVYCRNLVEQISEVKNMRRCRITHSAARVSRYDSVVSRDDWAIDESIAWR